MDHEAVVLVLLSGPAGVISFISVNGLPFTKLERLLELAHVDVVSTVTMSCEVVDLNQNVSLRAVFAHQAKDARVVA